MIDDCLQDHELRPYVQEVFNQTRFSLYAWNALQSVLSTIKSERKTQNIPGAFWLIHSFLTHAAMVSKIVKPSLNFSRNRSKDERRLSELRATQIGDLLGVNSTSPVLQRAMRDHLEHFDERLDHWNVESEHHNSLDMSFISGGGGVGFATSDHFRVLDPETLTFRFRDDEFELRIVADEMLRIQQAASHWLVEHRFQ